MCIFYNFYLLFTFESIIFARKFVKVVIRIHLSRRGDPLKLVVFNKTHIIIKGLTKIIFLDKYLDIDTINYII